jgi:bacillithiol biosynthesis deacetylase BshB1
MASPVDILVFGAHPDDAEFGMGGSLLKFVRAGRSVVLCVLTRGGSGSYGTPEVREKEARKAAAFLGAELEILDFQDCRIFDTFENRVALAELIRAYKPSLVFAPYHTNSSSPGDGAAHPDHLATGLLANHAARYARFNKMPISGEPWEVKNLFYYILPRYRIPTFIQDVSDYMEDWEKLARCHESQMELKNGNVISFLKRIRGAYGLSIGAAYGEAFGLDTPLPFRIESFF